MKRQCSAVYDKATKGRCDTCGSVGASLTCLLRCKSSKFTKSNDWESMQREEPQQCKLQNFSDSAQLSRTQQLELAPEKVYLENVDETKCLAILSCPQTDQTDQTEQAKPTNQTSQNQNHANQTKQNQNQTKPSQNQNQTKPSQNQNQTKPNQTKPNQTKDALERNHLTETQIPVRMQTSQMKQTNQHQSHNEGRLVVVPDRYSESAIAQRSAQMTTNLVQLLSPVKPIEPLNFNQIDLCSIDGEELYKPQALTLSTFFNNDTDEDF